MRRARRRRRCFPNSRNGTTPKTVASQVGDVPLEVPRDRGGTFIPRLVPKGSRRLGGPGRDDRQPLRGRDDDPRHPTPPRAATVGTEVSHETISKITDEVLAEVLAWQRRPLEAFYPVIYLDALVVKVRDGAHVRNKAAHIAVGVDLEGVKHVLGIWVQASEGSKFWAGVCTELANRGTRDVPVVCCDGLTGFAEAIEATWGQATIQTSSMHHGAGGTARPSPPPCTHPQRRRRRRRPGGTGHLHPLRPRPALPQHRGHLRARLGAVHPLPVLPARAAPGHLHHHSSQSLSYQLRKVIKNRGHFPNDDAAVKLLLARDLRHRGQAPENAPGTRETRQRPPRPTPPRRRTSHHELEAGPRPTRPGLPRRRPPAALFPSIVALVDVACPF